MRIVHDWEQGPIRALSNYPVRGSSYTIKV